jgi:prolipoprotein diacylglyceryl transferase
VRFATGPALTYLPSPSQGVWHLGAIPIRAYALCIIVGIIVAIVWSERRLVARGGQRGFITDVAVWAVPFGLVGGRLYHVCTDWWRYFGAGKNPIAALEIWDGGLGIPGAIFLGGVGAWIACRRRGVRLPFVADAIAPTLAVAQAIGRLGNYFNQELYGGPTTLPWGLEIFQRVNQTTGLPDDLNGVAINHVPIAIVHPTFLYEMVWDVIVAIIVVLVDRRLRLGHGRALALYVAAYAFGRFFIELMRSDEATHIFGVRVNVWMMTLLFIGGTLYFFLARGRGPREDPTTFRGFVSPVDTAEMASTEAPGEATEATAGAAEPSAAEPSAAGPGTAESGTAAEPAAETAEPGAAGESAAGSEVVAERDSADSKESAKPATSTVAAESLEAPSAESETAKVSAAPADTASAETETTAPETTAPETDA